MIIVLGLDGNHEHLLGKENISRMFVGVYSYDASDGLKQRIEELYAKLVL